jgi:hypothetical protein
VKDYYAILGVSHSASQSDIKKAYRKLAVLYHPDKNPSLDAKPRFQEINEAYDVLGDVEQRARYDAHLVNPFQELFSEPQKVHRDPAYRRRKKPSPSSRPTEPPASYVLMRDSLKYVIWISRVGLLVSTLFFVDYFLPYERVEETIEQIQTMRSRSSQIYHLVVTSSGKRIRLYDVNTSTFGADRRIVTSVSAIYRSVMEVSNAAGTYTAWAAYMYTSLIFFPILLFINSILALIYRRRVEFCFNLNVTAFILLIINLILI